MFLECSSFWEIYRVGHWVKVHRPYLPLLVVGYNPLTERNEKLVSWVGNQIHRVGPQTPCRFVRVTLVGLVQSGRPAPQCRIAETDSWC